MSCTNCLITPILSRINLAVMDGEYTVDITEVSKALSAETLAKVKQCLVKHGHIGDIKGINRKVVYIHKDVI